MTGHFQIDAVVVVAMSPYVEVAGNTAVTKIQVYGPKRTFTDPETIEQHVFTAVEMYQMGAQVVGPYGHLPLFYGHVGRSQGIKLFQRFHMQSRSREPRFP